MDFAEMLDNHKSLGADISVATIPVTEREAPEFGILKSKDGLIDSFIEKPKKNCCLIGSVTPAMR
jgi:glucose-1-phosphate adenylyltransferase